MYRKFLLLLFSLFSSVIMQNSGLYADNTVHSMILSASGISEDDIANASSGTDISLYDAFALSVNNTEKLSISAEKIIQARSQYSQSIGAYLPRISVNAERKYAENKTGTESGKDNTSVFLYGRQPILSGLNEWTGISKSKKEVSITYNNLALSAQQQLLTVAEKYYIACQLQGTLETDREIIGLYKKIRTELSRRVAVGKNRRNDLLRTDGQISRLEARLASIKSQMDTALSDLALSIGRKTPVTVSGGLDIPPPEYKPDNLPSIISRRIEIIIAKENSEVAGINLNTARGGHLPSVYLEGNYKLYSQGDDSADKYNVSVVASLPIFEGGITSGKIVQAESLKKQSDLILSETTRAVEKDITSSYNTWNSAVQQADAYKKALETAERNYNITMNDYRLSLVTILDVISILTELQQARSDYKTSLLALELSRIRLGVAINEFPGKGNMLLKKGSAPDAGKLQ